MSIPVGRVRLRIHPLLPVLWGLAFITGAGEQFFPVLLALALHECGHLILAKALRIPVEEMEITPFGGVMLLDDLDAFPPLHRFLEAAAGPLFSFLGCISAAVLYQQTALSGIFVGSFFRANMTLFLINLLPALPLDGGQMLRAVLHKFFPYAAITRILTLTASVFSIGLCACSLYFALRGQLLLSPAFAGLYLLYAAAIESRQCTAKYVTALIARRQRLERREALPVEAVAVSGNIPALQLLRRLHPGKYHMIYVLSPDGLRSEGILDEQEFCEAVLTAHHQSMGDALQKKKSRENAGGGVIRYGSL